MALWRAKQATVVVGDAIDNLSASIPLSEQLTEIDWSGKVKDISLSGAEADVDSVYFFGADIDGRQNADVEESNMTMREFSFTSVFRNYEGGELTVSEAVQVGTTNFYRITGDTTRALKAILITFTDGENTASVLMNNVYFTKMGDISLDAEGHAEQEIMGKCLAKNYYEEDDFD